MKKFFEMSDGAKALLKLYPYKRRAFYLSLFIRQRLLFNNFDTIEMLMPKEGRLIDIGCGYGVFTNYLALISGKRSVTGIDKNERKIRFAQRGLSNTEFRAGNVMNLDLGQCNGFSLIDMLHHLDSFEQQETLLKFCYDSLEAKGVILIKEIDKIPGSKFFFTKLVDTAMYPFDRIYFRGKNDLAFLLNKIGFAVKSYSIHKGTPYPAYVLEGKK